MSLPWGALVNALAIAAGGGVGMLFGSRLPERFRSIVFQALGLCVLVIGMKMALVTVNPVLVIFSLVLGALLGEFLQVERLLIGVGDRIKARFRSANPRFTEGMVNASVLFCIGAMAVLGSFDEGLRGDRTVVFSKAIIDGFAAMAMASAYGVGVLFSALAVFIYQGTLVVFAGSLQPWLGPAVMTELTALGGTLIVGIGLNMLEIVRIPLSNMLPSLLIVVALASFFA